MCHMSVQHVHFLQHAHFLWLAIKLNNFEWLNLLKENNEVSLGALLVLENFSFPPSIYFLFGDSTIWCMNLFHPKKGFHRHLWLMNRLTSPKWWTCYNHSFTEIYIFLIHVLYYTWVACACLLVACKNLECCVIIFNI
jgi:hypothetical protein